MVALRAHRLEDLMKVTFHGVRGSFPVPGAQTNRYGGNTTCVSVSKVVDGKIKRIILDSGTGIIPLGREIVGNWFQKKEDLDILLLFTHLHPDHTQGFPFFAPNFFSQCNIHLMGMKTLKKHIGTVLEQEMLPPTFPLEYKDLKSTRKHYELKDGQAFGAFGPGALVNATPEGCLFRVEAMQSFAPSHPQQGAMYYKITDNETGTSVACIWDLESHPGGDKRVINFSQGCTVMIHDTQYLSDEYDSEKMIVQGFGHSTYEMAVENALKSGAKALLCTHFNPSHSDDKLDSVAQAVKRSDLEVILAKEGLSVEI